MLIASHNMAANWSQETYRLDRVCDNCPLPCVVQVTEGIYRDSEVETVSAGDIIKIDKHTKIPKVAANFASSINADSEILVPLNYQGNVRIVSELKKYKSTEELAEDSPRYAEITKPLHVETESKKKLTVPKGTAIQLDRIIPGLRRGGKSGPGKLVITFTLKAERYTVAVPVNKPGQFTALPDNEEYTLKQVIERYKLPQTVEFLKNDLRKAYIETLEDVAENARVITDTLRLNRVVMQEMIIGHYKPSEETMSQNEAVSHRTLVLLPLDAEFVRDIEVNVLEDATEDDYERLCFVRDQSKAVTAAEEMIYVDFAKKSSIVRLDDVSEYEQPTSENRTVVSQDWTVKSPPLPTKPKGGKSDRSCSDDYVEITGKPRPPTIKIAATDDGGYIEAGFVDCKKKVMKSAFCTDSDDKHNFQFDRACSNDYVKMTGNPKPSAIKFADADDGGYIEADCVDCRKKGELPKKKQSFVKRVKVKMYSSNKNVKHHAQPPQSPTSPSRTPMSVEYQDDEDVYEDIDPSYITPNPPEDKTKILQRSAKRALTTPRPMAFVSPQCPLQKATEGIQSFERLTVVQLYERLTKCGMSQLAETCKDEGLDGPFITKVNIEQFKCDPFNLSDFEITKLEIIKANWVPH